MKLALLADIHSNIEALDACIDHARQQGAERFAFVGDLVGYNADPVAVLERIEMMVRNQAAMVVQGNHDEAVVAGTEDSSNADAARAIAWTRTQISSHHIDFLKRLPLTQRDDDILLVHASAAAPERWPCIFDCRHAMESMEAAAATYVFSGHVHDPMLYSLGRDGRPGEIEPVAGVPIPVSRQRQWLAIVGACGQPRDGNPAASYVLFDRAMATLTFHRVAYDIAAAARKVRAAGLPEALARRLETGNLVVSQA